MKVNERMEKSAFGTAISYHRRGREPAVSRVVTALDLNTRSSSSRLTGGCTHVQVLVAWIARHSLDQCGAQQDHLFGNAQHLQAMPSLTISMLLDCAVSFLSLAAYYLDPAK